MAFDKALLVDLSDDESKGVQRLIEKGITIPTQPRVLQELQQKLAQGVADVRVLARTIGQDPGMGAMLFRVVQARLSSNTSPSTRSNTSCKPSACSKPAISCVPLPCHLLYPPNTTAKRSRPIGRGRKRLPIWPC